MEFDEIFNELTKRSRPSLVSAPPVSFLYFFVSSYSDILPLFRQKVLVPYAPLTTTRTRMMTTAVYPPIMAFQTTKETLPMFKKVALPPINLLLI